MKTILSKFKIMLPTALFLLLSISSFSEEVKAIESNKVSFLDVNTLLAIVAFLLLIPIYILGKVFTVSVKFNLEKYKDTAIKIVALAILIPQLANAETANSNVHHFDFIFYVLCFVILMELLIIGYLGYNSIMFMKNKFITEEEEVIIEETVLENIWDKMNQFTPIEEEHKIDTGHSYDGIRELNNITPPWFTIGFISSIIFAIIYMWRYHVSHTAPLMIEEYQNAVAIAEMEKNEFLKNQANMVDENSVKMLSASEIAAGENLFKTHCAACHGANGASVPGGVGPNLSDNFWIHGNNISDIFKTIKYGYPDKGMKSWKDDFSPNQIAQLSSFIKSIEGKNLSGGKEPQGEEPKTVAVQDTIKNLQENPVVSQK